MPQPGDAADSRPSDLAPRGAGDSPGPAGRAGQLRHVVVVGAGLAGSRAVLELRAQGFTGRVTLVGAEPVPPYDRPPLSKHLLDRPEPAWLADELGADALAVTDDVRLGTRATALTVGGDGVRVALAADAVAAVAVAADAVAADAVIVATGAAAVRPRGWDRALTLHTAADAEALRAALGVGHGTLPGGGTPARDERRRGGDPAGVRRLVVIGAGWIGAEVATVAAAAGVDVTVVEAGHAPLATALGPEVGGLTRDWYAAAGVRLLTEAPVTEVGDGAVVLADGTTLPADAVLAAVGARPATGWLADALPLDPDGAVRVDEAWAPVDGPWRVRAVGDVARRRSRRHGWVPGGHWDAALRAPAQAVAGLLGTGDGTPADLAPYVFSTQLGHDLALYGLPGRDDEVVLRGDPATGGGWTALWFAPGSTTLTAALAVDRPRDVAGARKLFARPELPALDRARAADPGVLLPAAALG